MRARSRIVDSNLANPLRRIASGDLEKSGIGSSQASGGVQDDAMAGPNSPSEETTKAAAYDEPSGSAHPTTRRWQAARDDAGREARPSAAACSKTDAGSDVGRSPTNTNWWAMLF